MSLDKAVQFGKVHRSKYYGAKAVSRSCRCHGTCPHCLADRLYQEKKQRLHADDEERAYRNEHDVWQDDVDDPLN